MDNFSKTLNRNKYFYKIRNIDVLSWSTFFIPCLLICLREREWSQAPVTVWVPDSCLVRTFQPSFCFSRPYPNPLFKVLQFRLVSNRNISSNPKSLYGLTISPPQISFQDYITDKDQDNDFVFQSCVLRRPFKLSWHPWVPQGHQTRIRPSLSCLCSTTPQYSSILLVLHMSSNVEEISQRSQ